MVALAQLVALDSFALVQRVTLEQPVKSLHALLHPARMVELVPIRDQHTSAHVQTVIRELTVK